MNRSLIFPLAFIVIAAVVLTELKRSERERTFTVKTRIVKIDSVEQIPVLDDSLVIPVLYTGINGFENMNSPGAKARFISALLPAILVARHEIETTKLKITRLRMKSLWTKEDSVYVQDVKARFNAAHVDELLSRLVTLPNSIVLAQAAIETGWGGSRFFVEARNVFGIWSYDENESRVMAGKTRKNKRIYVRAYEDLSGSITDYFETLGRSRAYKKLRKARLETSDPFTLLSYLNRYSEQRNIYTRKLKAIILQNDLTRYDHYRIHPSYLIPE
jgi:Bax protein